MYCVGNKVERDSGTDHYDYPTKASGYTECGGAVARL
jgi:hypothetical protein